MKYTREFFEELEDDTEIKKFRLEEEWARQPQRYLKYAMASAYFQKRASEQEQSAKVLHATLKADAAEDPDACLGQGVKPTGDRCESYATQHPEYKKAKQAAIEAKYDADMALAAVFAMQQRKEALENLVRLQGMELYSEPKTRDGNFSDKATHRAVSEAIKERRREDIPRRRN